MQEGGERAEGRGEGLVIGRLDSEGSEGGGERGGKGICGH